MAVVGANAHGQDPELVDAHVHYSHDAWSTVSVEDALRTLRDAGVSRAFVSSSGNEGTLRLFAAAPEFIVPVLRPYRFRGQLSSWMHDEAVIDMLKERLAADRYAGIGEFHAFGDDIELPVLRAVIELAREHRVFLHAHSDIDAIRRIFAHDPGALVLWAHAGFEGPENVADMLERYPNLWADLAFRTEHAEGSTVDPAWRALFERYPDRFLLGSDTFTPERWRHVTAYANGCREWLAALDPALRTAIAGGNAENLLDRVGWLQRGE